MKRILCMTIPTRGQSADIDDTEAHHATQVLRLGDGAKVLAIDGRGGAVEAVLRIRGKRTWLDVADTDTPISTGPLGVLPLTMEVSILKGDAMEWVVEKCVELGVSHLVPLITERTVVQIDKKGPEAFQARWQKIADQALKQCGRLTRLEIALPISLEVMLATPLASGNRRLWCDEVTAESEELLATLGQAKTGESLHLLIGPEGGWSDRERQLLSRSACTRCSLGPLVLRAETAALCAASLASAVLRGPKT